MGTIYGALGHCSSHLQRSADTYFGGEGPSDGIDFELCKLGRSDINRADNTGWSARGP